MRRDVGVHISMDGAVFVQGVSLGHPTVILLVSPQLHPPILKPSLHLIKKDQE